MNDLNHLKLSVNNLVLTLNYFCFLREVNCVHNFEEGEKTITDVGKVLY